MFKAFSGNKYLKKSLNKMCVEPNHKTRVFFFSKWNKCADEHKFYFLYTTEHIYFLGHDVLSEI